jgi:hypothetical protein
MRSADAYFLNVTFSMWISLLVEMLGLKLTRLPTRE